MTRTGTHVSPPFSRDRSKAVLTQAAGLPIKERQRLIETSFPEDPGLRAELFSVLTMYDTAARTLSPEPDNKADAPTVEPSRPWTPGSGGPLLETGAAYGPYRVIKQLGAGGMGQVFLAEDVRLHRRVALKSLAGKWLESIEARQLLMQEARAAAALAHPSIATLYDVLEDGDHLLLVMEYVEGRTLRAVIDEGSLALGHGLRLAVQIADAVGYAHDRGIIHCDLKPANVQVANDGTPKILDFGLARARWAPEEKIPGSGSGSFVGTPAYMAPEWLGRGLLAPSADVYSLGVILFELLTGRRPFPATDLSSLILAVLSDTAPKPSSVRATVPIALDEVVGRALAKDPTLRYQSARELTRDLEPILSSVEPRVASRLTFAAFWFGVILIGLTLAGGVTSLAYALRLGSTNFAEESPLLWPYWGLRSMVLPLAVMVLCALAWALAHGTARVIFAAFKPVRRRTVVLRGRVQHLLEQLQSIPSSTLAQPLFFVNIVAVGVSYWVFSDIIQGLENFATDGSIAVLAPSHASHHRSYRMILSGELFVFGLAWYRLLRARYERREKGGFASLAGGVLAMMVTLGLLALPYRVLYKNVAERVSYQSQPCYLVGERSGDALLFCPRQDPPRNRLVRLDDPALQRGQVYESIFAELDRTP